MVKVKVKFALEQAMKAQRGSRGIALTVFNLDAGWGWVVNATARPLCPTYCIRGWMGPGPVWKGAENFALAGIRFPDRQVRSESIRDYLMELLNIRLQKWTKLTPWNRIFFDTLVVSQLVKFTFLYWIASLITVFRRGRYSSIRILNQPCCVYTLPPYFLRFTLILCGHLLPGNRSCLFFLGFSTRTLYLFLVSAVPCLFP